MIDVFGVRPAWGLPCVSPYVTKLVYWLRWHRVPHRLRSQPLATLTIDSPTGKLPYVVWPDGRRLADSSAIIAALALGDEAGLDGSQRAQSLAFTRLIDEHLVWHAVIEPRWADNDGWPRYRPAVLGEDVPDAVAAAIRAQIIEQWRGCGLGRLPAAQRADRARADVDALADRLGQQPFLLGDDPCRADAALAALVDHALSAPFASAAREAIAGHPTLRTHADRWRAGMAPAPER
jgi:glutathione S-transferase